MSRFAWTVKRLGEIFIREDGETHFKGSITNSTKAATNQSNRAYLFDGSIFKGAVVGEYITREFDGSTLLVETLHSQPRDHELHYAFLAQCNQKVTLAREKSVDAGSNPKKVWEVYAENVLAFKDIMTRALQNTNDGLIERDITTIHIPAKHGVKRMDRVYFMRQELPLEECECYQIDSINDSLTPLSELVDHTGIDILQLTMDTRTGEIATDEPDEPENPGGGGLWG